MDKDGSTHTNDSTSWRELFWLALPELIALSAAVASAFIVRCGLRSATKPTRNDEAATPVARLRAENEFLKGMADRYELEIDRLWALLTDEKGGAEGKKRKGMRGHAS